MTHHDLDEVPQFGLVAEMTTTGVVQVPTKVQWFGIDIGIDTPEWCPTFFVGHRTGIGSFHE
jgi:hypothetical protein